MKRYPEQQGQCDPTLRQFREDFRHPGLNFEKLGSARRPNHFSIRASQEWRIMLALPDPERLPPDTMIVVNFGLHDQAYGWSERQDPSAGTMYRAAGWARPGGSPVPTGATPTPMASRR